MPSIYMPTLVFKWRVRLRRLRVHRRRLRLESIGSPLAPPPPAPTVGTQVMTDVRPVAGAFRKKALLIGICGTGENALKGPHNDVQAMHDLLIDCYGYNSNQITVLLDTPNNIQPTKVNILHAIKDLVEGAEPGDRFFFYFAGHAGQEETNNPEEEDGKDEYILCSDEEVIQDDLLNEYLVDTIPSGCTLRAVIDACHSGSLLDLKHYACNRVYVPWISKGGKRKMRTLWYGTVKQNAILIPSKRRRSTIGSSYDTLLPPITNAPASSVSMQPSVVESTGQPRPKRQRCLTIVTEGVGDHIPSTLIPFTQSPIAETSSPKPRFCDSQHCFADDATAESLSNCADVLCLSSSRDEQKTWEDENGGSMTQKLVKLLRKDPNPTLHQMMTDVSHEIHNFYVDFHPSARQYKKKCAMLMQKAEKAARKAAQKASRQAAHKGASSVHSSGASLANIRKPPAQTKSLSLELVNFQDPELSSHFPIKPKDMRTRLWDM